MEKTFQIVVSRKRASGPKVRTGYITYKARHVRCDEQKPECHRCISTGRKCDGYAPHHTTQNRAVQQTNPVDKAPEKPVVLAADVERSLATIKVTKLEHHALDYFFNRAAPLLSTYYDQPFWNRLVLQLGQSEPAIRHAMITVSTAYEQMESDPKPLCSETSTSFSLQQCNKAMNHLIRYLSSANQTAEVPLIACILFICLEYIRGDIDRALTHLSSGINIMQSWRGKGTHKSSPISKEMISQSESVEQYLVRTFSWLRIASSMFRPPSGISQYGEEIFVEDSKVFPCSPLRFRSLHDTRISLYKPLNRAIRFALSMQFRKHVSGILLEDEREHGRIKDLLDRWDFGFRTFIWENGSSIDTREREALLLARIHWQSIWIFTANALESEESAYDQYITGFTRIVDGCETLLFRAPPFSFNVGYISPLFFVACRCRDKALRRRAVALLYQAFPRREIIYTAEQSYKIAVRTIQLEEAGMDPSSSTSLPPEWSRIHYADISRARSGPGSLVAVTFFSKPDGPRGRWKLHTEYMDLSSGVFEPFEDFIPAGDHKELGAKDGSEDRKQSEEEASAWIRQMSPFLDASFYL